MSDVRRDFAANTAYSALGIYLEFGAGFVTSIVIARQLGAEHYGAYTLALWLTSVGAVLSNHGLITGVMKFAGEARGRASLEGVASVLRYFERAQLSSAAVVALVGIAAGAVAVAVDRTGIGVSPRVLCLLVPAAALRSLYVYYSAVARGLDDVRAIWRVQRVVAPGAVALVAALALTGGHVESFVSAYLLVCLLSAVAMRSATRSRWAAAHRPVDPATASVAMVGRIRRHVAYASAIVVLELAVLRQAELVLLDWYATRQDVAYYGLGRSLAATALLLVPGAVTALLVPLMARTYGERPDRLGDRFLASARYLSMLAVAVVGLGLVFADALVAMFYGPEYHPVALVFRVAVAAGAVGVVSASASSYQLGSDRQPAVVAIMAAVASVTLILDFVLIRRFGLAGAILAGAAGAVLLGAGLLWHACRKLGVAFDWRTSARIVAAGGVSVFPVVLLAQLLPAAVAMPVGALVFAVAYLTATVVAGAWSQEDLRALRGLMVHLPARVGPPAAALLDWATRVGASPAAH